MVLPIHKPKSVLRLKRHHELRRPFVLGDPVRHACLEAVASNGQDDQQGPEAEYQSVSH